MTTPIVAPLDIVAAIVVAVAAAITTTVIEKYFLAAIAFSVTSLILEISMHRCSRKFYAVWPP